MNPGYTCFRLYFTHTGLNGKSGPLSESFWLSPGYKKEEYYVGYDDTADLFLYYVNITGFLI